MSIQNAKNFIEKVQTDSDFRKEMYKINGFDEFNQFMQSKDLTFDEFEFEEAYNLMLFKCQFSEEHDRLENAVNLIKLVLLN